MTLDHCACRGPVIAASRLARLRPSPAGFARRRPPALACRSITAPMRRCGRPPGSAVARGLDAGADRAWSTRRCSHRPKARRCPTSRCSANRSSPKRGEIASGEREAGFNPEIHRARSTVRGSGEPLRLDRRRNSRSCLRWQRAASRSCRSAPHSAPALGVERWMIGLLFAASLIAILTTLGIVLSLMFESLRFFKMVPPTDFLFGTDWSPQTAIRADQAGSSGAFGSVPLFWGTIFIGAIIAMIVAIPLGLMSAIYLTQYAHAARARLAQADPRDPRRRADRRLRLFRRADGRPHGARPRHFDRHHLGQQRKRARRRSRHGHHDHPVHQLDGRRFDRRRAAGDARRQPGDGRDQVRNDPQGRCFRPRFPAWSAASCSPSAARSARR